MKLDKPSAKVVQCWTASDNERHKTVETPRQKQLNMRRKIKELLSGLVLATLIGGTFAGLLMHWVMFGYIL